MTVESPCIKVCVLDPVTEDLKTVSKKLNPEERAALIAFLKTL